MDYLYSLWQSFSWEVILWASIVVLTGINLFCLMIFALRRCARCMARLAPYLPFLADRRECEE